MTQDTPGIKGVYDQISWKTLHMMLLEIPRVHSHMEISGKSFGK